MSYISKLLRRLLKWNKQLYLKKLYANKTPEIILDWPLRGYVHPSLLKYGSYFDIEELAEDLCRKGLCFEFKIGDEWYHHHEFRGVIEDAYNYGVQFSIPDDCEDQYSKQELELLRALSAAGENDRRKHRNDTWVT